MPSPRPRSSAAATATSPSDHTTSHSEQGGGPRPGALLVVEQDWDAPAGVLAGWAASGGITLRTLRVHAGDPFPPVSPAGGERDYDAVVVLGSEHTAYDDTLPWLAAELAFLDALLTREIPVLGICFGGQLLARVLGGRLYRLDVPEIGWQQVTSQHEAIAAGPWPSWHRDALTLPPGAIELASSASCLQAFSSGPHVGVQFHPEATEQIVASWLAGATPPPPREVTGPLFGADSAPAWGQAAANAAVLFSAWRDGSLTRSSDAQRLT